VDTDKAPPAPEVDPSTVLVRFRAGADKDGAAGRHGTRRAAAVEGTGYEVVQTDGADPDAKAAELRADPSVEDAQPNYVRRKTEAPNDPGYAQGVQPYLDTIRLPQAWSVTHGSVGLKIAVLDTGVQADHPDLNGRVLAGFDFVNNDANPADDEGHGTEVSGAAAAITNNSTGVAGAAWNASILPVKVLDSIGSGTDANIASGIAWAVNHGANIINLSLGGPGDDPVLKSAVLNAITAGVVVVAAAGNNGANTPFYPAAYDGVIAVGATTATGDMAWFSNHGPWVDLAAPGVRDVMPCATTVSWCTTGYFFDSGTSFSAPLVSGIIVLVKSQHPTWTPAEILAWLGNTATDRGPAGTDDYYGRGLIDAWAAVGGPGQGRSQPAGDALEPNDVPDRATTIALGSSQSGTISPQGDVDWYRTTAAADGSLIFSASSPPQDPNAPTLPQMDAVLSVYDTAYNLLGTADAHGNAMLEQVTVAATNGQQFLASVRNFNASGGVQYNLSASPSSAVSTPPGQQLWVRSTSPADFSFGLATTAAPSVTFARALDPATVATTVQLVDGSTGKLVPAAVGYNAGAQTVTLTPSRPLEFQHPYQVKVGAVQDQLANTFTEGYSYRFTTAGAPTHNVPTLRFYQREVNAPGPADSNFAFGSPSCTALSGDWDGDGFDTPGVYCDGNWYLRNSNTPGPPDIAFAYGIAGYVPVVGDWNGDGTDGIGVYVNGSWYLRETPSAGPPQIAFAYGTADYTPVVGNWDGNTTGTKGADGIGVYIDGSWYLRDTPSAGSPQRAFAYGTVGYKPVTGKFGGTNVDGVGIVTGPTWHLRTTPTHGPPHISFGYGDQSYQTITGDWDHDGTDTIAVGVPL
jgi:subtilisin family serine protease